MLKQTCYTSYNFTQSPLYYRIIVINDTTLLVVTYGIHGYSVQLTYIVLNA